MDGQYLQYSNAAPTARVQFLSTVDGSNVTSLVFNTAGLTLSYARDNGANVALSLVTATLSTWVANGFIHRGAGVYDVYLPIAANAVGARALTLLATALPASVVMLNCVIPMGVDDVSAAASTDTSISSATTTALAGNFTAIPAAVRTNLATELARVDAPVSGTLSSATLTSQVNTLRQNLSAGPKFGAAVTGGSSIVIPVYDAGNAAVLLGTVVVYKDATGAVVGQSALTPP